MLNYKLLHIVIISFIFIECDKDINKKFQENNTDIKQVTVIQGVIYDHNGSPLPQANIEAHILNDQKKIVRQMGAASDLDGNYHLNIDLYSNLATVDLVFSFIPYQNDTLSIEVGTIDTLKLNHQFQIVR